MPHPSGNYSYEVNCPDGGIEAGTDFTCIAEPIGLAVEVRIDTHLGEDGETFDPFDPFDPEPVSERDDRFP